MRFLFLCLMFITTTGFTQQPSNFFEFESRQPIHLNDTVKLKRALDLVIYKLKPGPEDLENPVLADAAPKAYLSQKTLEQLSHAPQKTIQFDSQKIQDLMHQASIPLLLKRPKILILPACVLNFNVQQDFVSPESDPNLYKEIKKAADAKGLELLFLGPHQSKRCKKEFIKIRSPMKGSEICEAIYEPIHAPVRLHMEFNKNVPDAKTIGAAWYAKVDGQDEAFRIKHESGYLISTYDKIAKKTMEDASEFLLTLEDSTLKKCHSTYVNISGITTVRQYKTLTNYLAQIPGVEDSHVHSVTADAALYKLDLVIPENLLHLRLARKFIAQPSDPSEGIAHYRLKL